MAVVQTDQGEFVICEEPHDPAGHVGPVWHRGQAEHPSGAILEPGEEEKVSSSEEKS